MSRAFKVGDRVTVVATDYFVSDTIDPQLGVGESGVVASLFPDGVGVIMDNGGIRRDDGSGHGWAFYDDQLAPESKSEVAP